MKRKAQIAVEFIILISLMLIMFLGFFAIANYRLSEVQAEDRRKEIAKVSDAVFSEIEIAKSVNNGYNRTFKVQKKIYGNHYTMQIIDNTEMITRLYDEEYVLFLPSRVCGDIFVGVTNEIKKRDKYVCVNSCWEGFECEAIQDLDLCGEIKELFPGTGCWCCNVYGQCCP